MTSEIPQERERPSVLSQPEFSGGSLIKTDFAGRSGSLNSLLRIEYRGVRALLPTLAIAAAVTSCAVAEDPRFRRSLEATKLQARALDEASGLTTSVRDGSFLWAINDSGGPPDLFLMETGGADRGRLQVIGARNVDWEDLSAFELDGQPFLLIADVGDNRSIRDHCTIYIVREPQLPAGRGLLKESVPVHHAIRFRYADGPRDCEAVAVDAVKGKILLISKRTKPPMIYELPLRTSGRDEMLVARKIGETSVQPPPAARLLPYIDQPTGLDLSRDRSQAAVVTYYGVFIFPRDPDQSWAEALAKPPVLLAPHLLPQAEAVAFSNDGKTIRVVSEGAGTPVVRYGK